MRWCCVGFGECFSRARETTTSTGLSRKEPPGSVVSPPSSEAESPSVLGRRSLLSPMPMRRTEEANKRPHHGSPPSQERKNPTQRKPRSRKNASPQREAQGAFDIWMVHGPSVSHDLSHFAAVFIASSTQTSTGGSCFSFLDQKQKSPRLTHRKNRVSFRSRKRTMAPPCGDSPAPLFLSENQGEEMAMVMIPPQVHLQRPCYDFSFL